MTARPFALRPTEVTLGRLAGGLGFVMIAGLLAGQFVPVLAPLNHMAAAAAVGIVLLRIGAVPRVAQVFVLGAVVAVLAVAVFAPGRMVDMEAALVQGTAFAAFLTTLGLIRAPVRASQVIGLAAARLFAAPARRVRAAITYGTQFLAVLFNIGTVGLMSDIAIDHAARAEAKGRKGLSPRTVTLAAMRGTTLATIWNPIGVGFAIVTAAIPALDPVQFLIIAFVTAMVLSAGSLMIGRETAPPSVDPIAADAVADHRGAGALIAILAAVAGLIAVTIAIHDLAGVSFLVAACLVLPVLAILWPRIEKTARRTTDPGPLRALGEATASTASEATIFLAATVIGAGVSLGLNNLGLDNLLSGDALPAIIPILGCLVLVPFGAALMVPHSVVVVLLAQLLGPGPVGTAHPQSLALALSLAWALAISASPISAMSILTAGRLGTSPARLGFVINRAFTLYGLIAGAAAVLLVYFLELELS